MRILATGFEPFGGRERNSSLAVVQALADDMETAVLPVAYGSALQELRAAVERAEPQIVVCFGQATGRAAVTVERVALNLADAGAPDNEGVVSTEPIRADGPVGYWATLPVDEIVAALRDEGIPAAPSRDAGGYLCNHVFYGLMDLLDGTDVVGGLVHLPLLPEQALDAGDPTMSLETLERAARIVVAVSSRYASGADQGARTTA
jgi:pyroglutamyl-peptidase